MTRVLTIVLLSAFCLLSCGRADPYNVAVKSYFDPVLYKTAHVNVQNDNYPEAEPKAAAFAVTDMGNEIRLALDRYGIDSFAGESSADLIVECHLSDGWGPPSIGRHFRIDMRYINKVRIVLRDRASNKVLADIKYTRPFLDTTDCYFIRTMMTMVMNPRA